MKKSFLSILLILMLAACAPQIEATNEVSFVTEPVQMDTAIPTLSIPTATITSTPTLVPTSTLTPTETLVPTEVVNFEAVKIIGVDKYPSYASVIFEFPAISNLYQVKINNSTYNCQIPEGTVDRLFCSGQEVRTDEYVDVKFYEDETLENELAALNLYVPQPYATPLPAGDPSTWCPARGTNISCETEHRVEFGEECWVQTCTDACGYYYSYHTCQLPPNNNFLPP